MFRNDTGTAASMGNACRSQIDIVRNRKYVFVNYNLCAQGDGSVSPFRWKGGVPVVHIYTYRVELVQIVEVRGIFVDNVARSISAKRNRFLQTFRNILITFL